MAGQDGGYALGVDLGTSNTVAVLRWPDGRTRPLLFDGQPVMPSGVLLDGTGRLHVGRDAQRLALTDPARYEPNPKRRIDEAAVLLGDREVPTADLLAAVLQAVAQAAVEAVGFLPPAVLTHPAAWGPRRREVLAEAVARAGWPPVAPPMAAPPGPAGPQPVPVAGPANGPQPVPVAGPANGPQPVPVAAPVAGTRLVPEPVAAARYFSEVLRRPVPVGSALAVFDFGGGTLDVAVVRNEGLDPAGRPRFVLVGSGGVAELGGLDLDAALVEHLGDVIGKTDPQTWWQLQQPASVGQWRARRQFWEDVRGAKEMLSRTTVAPVAVPGVEQAVHLTRDELERLAAPLLRRGVFETASVIAQSRLTPDQLAGLFLVGGSSRVPLVARLLHTELGVAPTVLEQPEMPVAEGALAEITTPPAPQVPAPPVREAPQARAVSAPPGPGGTAPPGPGDTAPPVPPAAVRGTASVSAPPAYPVAPAGRSPAHLARRPVIWIGAVLALVAVAVTTFLYLTRDPYDDIEFQTFRDIGRIKIGEDRPSYVYTAVTGDRAYLAYEREDERLEVIGAEAGSAGELWRVQIDTTATRWAGITALPGALVVLADESGDSTPRKLYVLNPGDGKTRWSRDVLGDDRIHLFGSVLVLLDRTADRLLGLDLRDGQQKWEKPNPKDQYGGSDTAVYPVSTEEGIAAAQTIADEVPAPPVGDDPRLVQIGADRTVRVIDVTTGKVVRSRPNVADPRDLAVAHEGRLYVAAVEGGYRLAAYDLTSLGEPANLYTAADGQRRPERLIPCGEKRVCLLETANFDGKSTELVMVDSEAGFRWRKPAAEIDSIRPVGEYVMLSGTRTPYRTTVLDSDGATVVTRDGVGLRVDGGNLLVFADGLSGSKDNPSVAGVPVSGSQPVELGQLKAVRSSSCSWNATVIVCGSDEDFVFRRFAAG